MNEVLAIGVFVAFVVVMVTLLSIGDWINRRYPGDRDR